LLLINEGGGDGLRKLGRCDKASEGVDVTLSLASEAHLLLIIPPRDRGGSISMGCGWGVACTVTPPLMVIGDGASTFLGYGSGETCTAALALLTGEDEVSTLFGCGFGTAGTATLPFSTIGDGASFD
jgi:hypothetical protein